MAVTSSPAPVAGASVTVADRAHAHYVDWPAILAGAVLASAVAFVLSAFGTALGLTMTSPYRGEGVSGVWVAIAVGLWILWVALTSFMAGGYIAGRLRRRIGDGTPHEVEVRDGAHGLLVWSVATLLGAGLLLLGVYGAGNIATQGASAASSAAATVAGSRQRGQDDGGPYALVTDRMFVGGDEATKPGGDVARRAAIRVIGEAALAGRKPSDADRTYLAKLVAARTGVDEPTAQARVDEAQKQADEIAAKAKQVANAARKVGIVSAFLIAVSLLIGGAAAYWAAGLGGRHRDEQTTFEWLRWR